MSRAGEEATAFTVRADARQSARWKRKAEAEGYQRVEQWAAFALDAYLELGAKAGTAMALAWRSGSFSVRREDGEVATVAGFLSPPFGAFAGTEDSSGTPSAKPFFALAYLPEGRILATLRTYKECKALAAELARAWRSLR